MITDYRLLVFKKVAQLQSFSKAASELSLSQPAVSRHIKELEKQIGSALFIRGGGKVHLTPKGEELFRFAVDILSEYEALNEHFFDHAFPYKGSIIIGASSTISQYFLPVILARFKKAYPSITITLHNGNSEQIEQMIIQKSVSFGIIEGNYINKALHYDQFIKDEIVLVTSTSNKSFAHKESITPEELTTLPIVVRESGSGTLEVIQEALENHGIGWGKMNIDMKLGSTESIKRYVEESGCFAFISIGAVSDEIKDGKLRIIDVEGLEIIRNFRFVSLLGEYGRLYELFRTFCLLQYNKKL